MRQTIYKQWLIKDFNEQDIEYLGGCECRFEIEYNKPQTFEVSSGQIFRYQGITRNLYVVTSTPDAESKVLLKFGGRMTLMHFWSSPDWDWYES